MHPNKKRLHIFIDNIHTCPLKLEIRQWLGTIVYIVDVPSLVRLHFHWAEYFMTMSSPFCPTIQCASVELWTHDRQNVVRISRECRHCAFIRRLAFIRRNMTAHFIFRNFSSYDALHCNPNVVEISAPLAFPSAPDYVFLSILLLPPKPSNQTRWPTTSQNIFSGAFNSDTLFQQFDSFSWTSIPHALIRWLIRAIEHVLECVSHVHNNFPETANYQVPNNHNVYNLLPNGFESYTNEYCWCNSAMFSISYSCPWGVSLVHVGSCGWAWCTLT